MENGHFAFLSSPLGAQGQRTMFFLGSLESAYSDFLLVLIELFAKCYR